LLDGGRPEVNQRTLFSASVHEPSNHFENNSTHFGSTEEFLSKHHHQVTLLSASTLY
jgi:hypothetical protein